MVRGQKGNSKPPSEPAGGKWWNRKGWRRLRVEKKEASGGLEKKAVGRQMRNRLRCGNAFPIV